MERRLDGALLNACAILVALCCLFVRPAPGQEPPGEGNKKAPDRAELARAAATEWLEALTKADVPRALAASDVPFALDGKKILETVEELEAVYKKIAEDKGARDMKPTSVEVVEDVQEVVKNCAPQDVIIVRVKIEGEEILICVRPGKDYKVTGFRD